MQSSDQFNEIAAALAAAQAEFKVAPLNSINPFFKSRFANLYAIREATYESLAKNKLAILQTHKHDRDFDEWSLETTLIHSSGQWFRLTYPLLLAKKDAHGFAAATTYARRVSWQTICGAVASGDEDAGEDDDGNTAVGGEPDVHTKTAKTEAQARAESEARAELWVGRALEAVKKMENLDQLKNLYSRNEDTIKNMAAINASAYAKFETGYHARVKQLTPDVPPPKLQPEVVAMQDEPAPQWPEWFVRAMDDVAAIEDIAALEDMHAHVMDRMPDDNDMLSQWAKRYDSHKKVLQHRKGQAKKK